MTDIDPWSMPLTLRSNDTADGLSANITAALTEHAASAILANTNDTIASDSATSSQFYYEDGQVIQQKWHVAFIFIAYVIAYIGAYAAIRLLEHGLWRSKREEANASTFLSKHPKFFTALILASCTIWSMHFVGMQAVQLMHVEMCYDMIQTISSLVLSVAGVWAGVTIASNDIFSGPDRILKLKELLQNDPYVTSKLNRTKATQHIHMVALLYHLQWIALGSLLAAVGALSMHYVGMHAMKGPFVRQWNLGYLSGSVALGVVVCFAGFWILFRPLHWKVEKSWYRYLSAAVIALAVCCLHFLGMLSVTYVADSTLEDSTFQFCAHKDMWGWKTNQLGAVGACMAVPFVAFLVEHTISNELRLTYRQLMDINLNRSGLFQSRASTTSRVSNGGRTSTGTPRRGTGVHVSGLDDSDASELSSSSLSPRSWGKKKKTRRLGYQQKGRKSLSTRNREWNSAYNSGEQTVSDLGESWKPTDNNGSGSFNVSRESNVSVYSHDDAALTSMAEDSSMISHDVENQAQRSSWESTEDPNSCFLDDSRIQLSTLPPMLEEVPEKSDNDGTDDTLSLVDESVMEAAAMEASGSQPATAQVSLAADANLPSLIPIRHDDKLIDEFLDHLHKSLATFEENGQSLETFVNASCRSRTVADLEDQPQHRVASESA